MGLQRVTKASIALLRAGEEFDQRSSLRGISLCLLLQSSGDAAFPRAGDEPGLSNTVVDDGAEGKSEEKHWRSLTEPGHSGELKLSLGWTGEMKSAGCTVGGGREEDQEVLSTDTAHQGLRLLLLLFSVVGA